MRSLRGLKICFVAGTLGQGGAERQLYYNVKSLKESGAHPLVLCLNSGEFWEAEIRRLGVPVVNVGRGRSRVARLAKIVSVLRNERPDLVQSQHCYTNLYVVVASRVLGLADIGALRGDVFREISDTGRLFGRLSVTTPRTVVANSAAAISNAVMWGVARSKLHLLPNVVDTAQFLPTERRAGRPVRLTAVGRLSEEKQFDRFLSVLARLRDGCQVPFSAAIVGDGPERQRLEQQAVDLRLGPSILQFRGAVRAMVATYHESDVLVLTSRSEGTPNVILEAMACGLPVVATNVGGVAEVVEDGHTGYLTTAGDEDSLYDALLQLMTNRSLRWEMGQRGRTRVMKRHSPQQLPERLGSIYQAALS
jgi:glycosyltransferase involved in cell wall biosynthesis